MISSLLERLRKAALAGDVEDFVSVKYQLLKAGYTIHGHRIDGCEHSWTRMLDNETYFRCARCEALGYRNLRRDIVPILCRECHGLATRWVAGSPNCRKDH